MSKSGVSLQALPEETSQTLVLLGKRIRLARKRRNLTIKEIARCMYASPVTVRKVECGDPSVSLGMVASVLACLGLPREFDKLIRFEDDAEGIMLDRDRLEARKRVRVSKDPGLNF
jgi:transcriptional regulator with XRE-family HTH domain